MRRLVRVEAVTQLGMAVPRFDRQIGIGQDDAVDQHAEAANVARRRGDFGRHRAPGSNQAFDAARRNGEAIYTPAFHLRPHGLTGDYQVEIGIEIEVELPPEALGRQLDLDLDPDLHLIVAGETVRPQMEGRGIYRFTIPASSVEGLIASRSTVPAEIAAASRDVRRLGVLVDRIVLADADLSIEAWHGHTELCDGFHADEPAHRWTNGLARIPDSLLRHFAGPLTLEVHLVPNGLGYRLPVSTRRRRRTAKRRAAAITR